LIVATARSKLRAGSRSGPDRDLLPQSPSIGKATSTNGSLLFADDVAAMVGMTRDWIYAETRAGRIPYVALGRYYRYRPESIDAWLRDIERGSVEARYTAERR
jgi:excisionase family DNA binding protein